MTTFYELWSSYGLQQRPANIGDVVDGVRIGDLDDEIQDVASSYGGLASDEFGVARTARLGLALDGIMQVLPKLEPADTRNYFARLARLARTMLVEIATGRPNER